MHEGPSSVRRSAMQHKSRQRRQRMHTKQWFQHQRKEGSAVYLFVVCRVPVATQDNFNPGLSSACCC